MAIILVEIKTSPTQTRNLPALVNLLPTPLLHAGSKTIQQCHMCFAADPRTFLRHRRFTIISCGGWFICFYYITEVVIFRLRLRWARATARRG